MKTEINNQLELLVFLFGNHYGTSFYLLNTPMTDIPKIQKLVDDGEFSPSEIDDLVRI